MNDLISQYIKNPGNAVFLLDIPGCEELYQKCKNAEEAIEKNYKEFFWCVRLALEEFASIEETKRRLAMNQNLNYDKTKADLLEEFKTSETKTANVIILSAKKFGNLEKLNSVMCDYSNRFRLSADGVFDELTKAIRDLRHRSNNGCHIGNFNEDYTSSNKAIELLFNIIAAYYGKDYKYDFEKQPFGKQYPIPKKLLENAGIKFIKCKPYFEKDQNGKIIYYLAIPSKPNPTLKQQHAASMLYKLWDNVDTPENMIAVPKYESNDNGIDYCHYSISLLNFCFPLSSNFIGSLNKEEKMSIISGIIKGIATLHNYNPPLYHRAISLDSFVVYKIKNKTYKPLLIQFDSVKNTDTSVDEQNNYTVFTSVRRNATAYHSVSFFAPELIQYCMSLNENQEIDWGKADIYSLGSLINFFDAELTTEQNEILKKMTDKEPDNRPDINTVKKSFCD